MNSLMMMTDSKKIVVVDFGGQYAHLIARRIRECNVLGEIIHPEDLRLTDEIAGIILSGGPRSVTNRDIAEFPLDLHTTHIPILGICYGHQLLAVQSGGDVASHKFREYGRVLIHNVDEKNILGDIRNGQYVWMSHGDSVVSLPDDFLITASSETTAICAFKHKTNPIYGVQFHPEVYHTENGKSVFEHFVDLCNIKKQWIIEKITENIISSIKNEAQDKQLLVFVSGGVDSLVTLMLCVNAVGAGRIVALHIDTGLMRLNESRMIMEYLHKIGLSKTILLEEHDRFLGKLSNISDPEVKRKIIGAAFVDVMHDFLSEHNHELNQWMLVQGTIYPDTIESGGTKMSGAIKTHHNRVPEIEEMIHQGRVIEPLKELYKDEVRKVGLNLGLPEELVFRRPFPGPGLAIRILADDNTSVQRLFLPEQLEIELSNSPFEGRPLPIKSVGVQGDDRTYRRPLLLWYKEGNDFSWRELKEFAANIINTCSEFNRVVFSLIPVTSELSLIPTYVNEISVRLLQQVDWIVQSETASIAEIWQLPVISLPLCTNNKKQTFVLRPITSLDAMTADVYEMPVTLLRRIINRIQTEVENCGFILYDVTTKPPGTIEWE